MRAEGERVPKTANLGRVADEELENSLRDDAVAENVRLVLQV